MRSHEVVNQLHAVNHRLRKQWMARLAPYDLSPHHYRALAALVRAEEGIRLKAVADRLRIAPRSATEVVDYLEDKGLARRSPDPADRRAVLVQVTDEGRALHQRVHADRADAGEEFLAVLSTAEQDQLGHLLSRLLDAHPRSTPEEEQSRRGGQDNKSDVRAQRM